MSPTFAGLGPRHLFVFTMIKESVSLLSVVAFAIFAGFAQGSRVLVSESAILNEFLERADLRLPWANFSLPLPGLGVMNCSARLFCREAKVEEIGADWDKSEDTIDLSVNELSSICSGDLFYLLGDGKSHRLGVEIKTHSSSLDVGLKVKTDENGVLMHVSTWKCRANFHYHHDAFKLFNDQLGFLTEVEERILNLLAPIFGQLALGPASCISLKSLPLLLNPLVSILRSLAAKVFDHEISGVSESVSALESKVRPRIDEYGPSDKVFQLKNNQIVDGFSAFSETFLGVSDPYGEDLRINEALRNSVLVNETAKITIEPIFLPKSVNLFGVQFELALTEIEIVGVDSISALSLLKAIGNFTTANHIAFSKPLRANANVRLFMDRQTSQSYHHDMTLAVTFENVDVKIGLLTAIDKETLLHASLGGAMKSPTKCFFSLFADIDIATFKMSPSMKPPRISVSGDDPFMDVANVIVGVLSGLAMDPVWAIFISHQNLLAQNIGKAYLEPLVRESKCPVSPWPPVVSLDPLLVDFRSNNAVRLFRWLFNDFTGVQGPIGIDKMLDWLFEYALGDSWDTETKKMTFPHLNWKLFDLNLLKVFPSLPPQSRAVMWIDSLEVAGAANLESLLLFKPTSSRTSHGESFSMHEVGIWAKLHWNVTGLSAEKPFMEDHVVLNVTIPEISMEALLETKIDLIAGASLTIPLMASTCSAFAFKFPRKVNLSSNSWRERLRPLESPVAVKSVDLQIPALRLEATCDTCSTGNLAEILSYLSEPDSNQDLNEFLACTLGPLLKEILEFDSARQVIRGANVNFALNSLLLHAKDWCVGNSTENDGGRDLPQQQDSLKPWWIPPMQIVMMTTALVIFVIFVGSISLAACQSRSLRYSQSTRLVTSLISAENMQSPLLSTPEGEVSPSLESSDHRQVVSNYRSQLSSNETSRHSLLQSPLEVFSQTDRLYLLGRDRAMIVHPAVKRRDAIIISLALWITFMMFVTGNFFTFGRVVLFVEFANEQWVEIPLLTLSIDNSIDMLAESGAIFFFAFLAFCSGLLPWVRVAVLCYLWIVPANIITVERRGFLLYWLESFAKWTMPIFYLFAVLTASMKSTVLIPSPDLDFLPPGTAKAYIETVPMWGLLSFLTASLSAMTLNHVLVEINDEITCHNQDTITPRQDMSLDEDDEDTGEGEDVVEETERGETEEEEFLLDEDARTREHTKGRISQLLLYGALWLWPPFLILIFAVPAYEFRFMGFSGISLQAFGSDGSQELRRESLGALLWALASADPAHRSFAAAQVLFFLCYLMLVVVAPALHMFVVALLSSGRLPNSKRFLRYTEGWDSLSVFCTSILVMTLEIDKFFNTVAHSLQFCPRQLGIVFFEVGALPSESVCFGIETKIDVGWYFLIAYIVYSYGCTKLVHNFI